MKKFLPGAAALLLAVAFSAFTAPAKPQEPTTSLYWFDPSGTFIGYHSVAVQDADCPDGTQQLCARGYAEIDENEEPVGQPVQNIMKP